ncbi:hypothetical protein [Cohnella panacarvi]|uniref:hypothetical protein n=1 Tax=Cohnella panacarvi TaxID=400776 RepID=UPI0004AED7B1|nr:hypothetical protein [Cohnella panacarvi]
MKWLVNGAIVVNLLVFYADVSFINAAITATALTIIAYFIATNHDQRRQDRGESVSSLFS